MWHSESKGLIQFAKKLDLTEHRQLWFIYFARMSTCYGGGREDNKPSDATPTSLKLFYNTASIYGMLPQFKL